MSGQLRVPLSLSLSLLLCSFACVDDGENMDGAASGETGGDGDGDSSGDGDGSPDTGPATCDVPSPYQGGWAIGCCQDNIVPTPWNPGGIGQGSVLPDWTFTDQFGDSVRVWDFCQDAIYFDYAAVWCGACQQSAPELAALYETYKDRGLMTLTYMSENANGDPAQLSDVQAWAQTYNQNGLVVFSSDQNVWYPFGVDQGGGSYGISLPGTIFVGPEMKIAKMSAPTTQEIELVLPGK